MTFNTIKEALTDLKLGKMIIVVDDENRENEGDLLMLADKVTSESVNFMAKYGRGLICVPMQEDRLKELGLEQMIVDNTDSHQTAFTVSVDAVMTTTGISAFERAETILKLIDPSATKYDFKKPGHIFPLRAKSGGVLVRNGHTEAAVDLALLSGSYAAGVICEIMKDDGTMARVDDLFEFAKTHDLKMITIKDLVDYRKNDEIIINRVSEAKLPTKYGEFTMIGYEHTISKEHHVALVKGAIDDGEPVLVRVHSECLTGDAFGSLRCDCGEQFAAAMQKIEEVGRGVLLYMRQEGRGIGLINKIKAYALQDEGYDTVEANEALGFPDDMRNYTAGIQILADLGISKMRLMTNNPKKIEGLGLYNIEIVERIQIQQNHNEKNEFYLKTKKDKLGHMLNFDKGGD